MKIIRWLLSHIFLILLIVAVIYGYMFWGNLAGKDTPVGKAIAYLSSEFVEVEEFINAVKAKQAELTGDKNTEEKAPSTVTDATGTVAEYDKAAEAVSSSNELSPVSISYSHNNTRVIQSSEGSIEISAENAAEDNSAVIDDQSLSGNVASPATSREQLARNAAPESIKTKDVFVPQEIEQQLNNVDVQGKAIEPVQQGSAVRDTWITARRSFYQRNYELSESSYQEVIANTEDNYDAYGELGNVYFNQGKNKQAAAAYYEAAAILIRKGQVNRAKSLMGLLRHLDAAKATELQELIDSTLS